MQENLIKYRRIVGNDTIERLFHEVEKIKTKHITCISSTYQGGGVAEMLNSIVPLFDDLGLSFGWRILHGSPDFFTITKKYHNSLQGDKINLTKRKKHIYYETNRRFSKFTHLDHDLIIVHDPQPLPLIDFYKKEQPWIFRGHIDFQHPNPQLWGYLSGFIKKYDHMVISNDEYRKDDVPIEQSIIYPAIDPLTLKNKPLNAKTINTSLAKFGINLKKPIISQVSRFDKFKDPKGVLKVFNLVRKHADCQLVLLGSLATDDPEGQKIFNEVERAREKSAYKDDIKLLLVENEILVNAVQSASTVVIQKSTREGFGLVVTEALYKKTPVVASNVGGIPFQIIDGVTGFLHEPNDIKGFSESILTLLFDDKLREELGENGHEHVRKNFLITRLMLDWLNLFQQYLT